MFQNRGSLARWVMWFHNATHIRKQCGFSSFKRASERKSLGAVLVYRWGEGAMVNTCPVEQYLGMTVSTNLSPVLKTWPM